MYQERKVFIDSINEFIASSKASLNHVLEEIGWSKESIYSALQETRERNGQGNNSSNINTTGDSPTGCPENGAQNEAVETEPLYNELVASLTQAQSSTKPTENKCRTEVYAEMLQMERDAKRRRINYKNRVHTKNKSHLEIIREVLAEQMSTHFEGVETSLHESKKQEAEKVKTNLVEINYSGGNPHTAWRRILEGITESKDKKKSSKDLERSRDKYRGSSSSKFKESDDKERSLLDRPYNKYNSKHLNDDSDAVHHYKHRDERYHRTHSSERSHSRSEVYYDKRKTSSSLKHQDTKMNRGNQSFVVGEENSLSKNLNSDSDEYCHSKKHLHEIYKDKKSKKDYELVEEFEESALSTKNVDTDSDEYHRGKRKHHKIDKYGKLKRDYNSLREEVEESSSKNFDNGSEDYRKRKRKSHKTDKDKKLKRYNSPKEEKDNSSSTNSDSYSEEHSHKKKKYYKTNKDKKLKKKKMNSDSDEYHHSEKKHHKKKKHKRNRSGSPKRPEKKHKT